MSTATSTRTDLATRWKVHRVSQFLDRHTDSLDERFGASETASMRREMLE